MTIGVNDYPFRNDSCGPAGLCGGYAKRNCTDFCAWRITNDLRHSCISGLGNALTWGTRARAQGFAVDGSPRPHDIAVFQPGNQGAGGAGHVAFVQSVSGNRFTAEQYNYGLPEPCCCYTSNHTFSTAGVAFIHIAAGSTTCTPACAPPATCRNGVCVTPTPPPCSAGSCPGGSVCVGTQCQCPAGTFWNGVACVPPVTSFVGGSLLPALLLFGAAGAGYWQARRHREATAAVLHDDAAFGSRESRFSLHLPGLPSHGSSSAASARGFGG